MADYKALAELPLDPENGGVFYAPQVRGIFTAGFKGRELFLYSFIGPIEHNIWWKDLSETSHSDLKSGLNLQI